MPLYRALLGPTHPRIALLNKLAGDEAGGDIGDAASGDAASAMAAAGSAAERRLNGA